MPAPPEPVTRPVMTVPAATPVPDSPSVTATVPLEHLVIVRVKPEIDPVQVATVFVVDVTFSVVKLEVIDAIGSQTNSTPALFNSARVMSVPGVV